MPFDARRWPNAVTIAWLIAERMGMGVHCQNALVTPCSIPPRFPLLLRRQCQRLKAASNAPAADRVRARRGRNFRGGD